jgi:hypothetical protein
MHIFECAKKMRKKVMSYELGRSISSRLTTPASIEIRYRTEKFLRLHFNPFLFCKFAPEFYKTD